MQVLLLEAARMTFSFEQAGTERHRPAWNMFSFSAMVCRDICADTLDFFRRRKAVGNNSAISQLLLGPCGDVGLLQVASQPELAVTRRKRPPLSSCQPRFALGDKSPHESRPRSGILRKQRERSPKLPASLSPAHELRHTKVAVRIGAKGFKYPRPGFQLDIQVLS